MKLVFEMDESSQRIIGRFRLGPEYQGATGFIHGGIIATLLDEVMSKVSRFSNVRAVTAELTIEYLLPVRVAKSCAWRDFPPAARAASCTMKERSAMPPEICWRGAGDGS